MPILLNPTRSRLSSPRSLLPSSLPESTLQCASSAPLCSAPCTTLSASCPSFSGKSRDSSGDSSSSALSSQRTRCPSEGLSRARFPKGKLPVTDTEAVLPSHVAQKGNNFLSERTAICDTTPCQECRPPGPLQAEDKPPFTTQHQNEGDRKKKEGSGVSPGAGEGEFSSLPESPTPTSQSRLCISVDSSRGSLLERRENSLLTPWEGVQANRGSVSLPLEQSRISSCDSVSESTTITAGSKVSGRKGESSYALRTTAETRIREEREREARKGDPLREVSSRSSDSSSSSESLTTPPSARAPALCPLTELADSLHSDLSKLSGPLSYHSSGCSRNSSPSSVPSCSATESVTLFSSDVSSSSPSPESSSASCTSLLTPYGRPRLSVMNAHRLFPPKPTLFPCTVRQQAELYVQVLHAAASFRPAFCGPKRHAQLISFHISHLQKAASQEDLAPYETVFSPLFRVARLSSTRVLPVPGFAEWLIQQSARPEDSKKVHGEDQNGGSYGSLLSASSVRGEASLMSQRGDLHLQSRTPLCHKQIIPIHDYSTFALLHSESSKTCSRVREGSVAGTEHQGSPERFVHSPFLLHDLGHPLGGARLSPTYIGRSSLSSSKEGEGLPALVPSAPASCSAAQEADNGFLSPVLEEVYNRLHSLFCDLKSVHSFRLTPEPSEGLLGMPMSAQAATSSRPTWSAASPLFRSSSRSLGAHTSRGLSAEGGSHVLRDGTVTAEAGPHDKRSAGSSGGRGAGAGVSTASRVASFAEGLPLTQRFYRTQSATVANPDGGLRLFFPSSDLAKMMRRSVGGPAEENGPDSFSLTRTSSLGSSSAVASPGGLDNRGEDASSEKTHEDGWVQASSSGDTQAAPTSARGQGTLAPSERILKSQQPRLTAVNLLTAPPLSQLVHPTTFQAGSIPGVGTGVASRTILPLCSAVSVSDAVFGLHNFSPAALTDARNQSLLTFLSCLPPVCTLSSATPSQVVSPVSQQSSIPRPDLVPTSLQSVVSYLSSTAPACGVAVPSDSQSVKNDASTVVRGRVSADQIADQSAVSATSLPFLSSVLSTSPMGGGSLGRLPVVQPQSENEGVHGVRDVSGGLGTGSSQIAASVAESSLSSCPDESGLLNLPSPSLPQGISSRLVSPSAEAVPPAPREKAAAVSPEATSSTPGEPPKERQNVLAVSLGKPAEKYQKSCQTSPSQADGACGGQKTLTPRVADVKEKEIGKSLACRQEARTLGEGAKSTKEGGEPPSEVRSQSLQLHVVDLTSDRLHCSSRNFLHPPVSVPVSNSTSMPSTTPSSSFHGLASRLPVLKGVSPAPFSFSAPCSISTPGVLIQRAAADANASSVTIRPAPAVGTTSANPAASPDSLSSTGGTTKSFDINLSETTSASASSCCRPRVLPSLTCLQAGVSSLLP
ncbi:ap2 domain transcription factor ap2viia-5, partial [Cystoisospora suis]